MYVYRSIGLLSCQFSFGIAIVIAARLVLLVILGPSANLSQDFIGGLNAIRRVDN